MFIKFTLNKLYKHIIQGDLYMIDERTRKFLIAIIKHCNKRH